MNRRRLVAGCLACGVLAAGRTAWAQTKPAADWAAPARFARPEVASDEGGLWAIMDREERNLRRSPFLIRDEALNGYIRDIACRLGGEHCADVRVYIVNTPLFNASMAPNGMMQVWSGLLLRLENEAQLAAVLGHEIGHYLEKHTLERLRDVRGASAAAAFLSVFGLVGAIGQLALAAGLLSYSRDQETRADRIGSTLMHRAGYDPAEAAKVWGNLLQEVQASPDGAGKTRTQMFATHPGIEERQQTLAEIAKSLPSGKAPAETWAERMRPYRMGWLHEEVKRGRYDESIALLTRMAGSGIEVGSTLFARGESYRLRGKEGDIDLALADFQAALSAGSEPAETHRSLGYVYRRKQQHPQAKASLARYLELAPGAPDSSMVKSILEELGS
ncbi:MAG: M48 family metalloprotease [Burkholderiales bacterium]|nr:M48 family metalloprotease [Burkholderiales bacterium]